MRRESRTEEHQHFSDGTLLATAVAVDLIAIMMAILLLSTSILLPGLVLATGAVITGLLVRRPVGRNAMWLCFFLAAIIAALALIVEMSTVSIQ